MEFVPKSSPNLCTKPARNRPQTFQLYGFFVAFVGGPFGEAPETFFLQLFRGTSCAALCTLVQACAGSSAQPCSTLWHPCAALCPATYRSHTTTRAGIPRGGGRSLPPSNLYNTWHPCAALCPVVLVCFCCLTFLIPARFMGRSIA